MLDLTPARETAAEATITDYVLHRLELGIYDPLQPRRTRMPVVSFAVEILEFDEESATAHAAGPVVLRAPVGDVEQFLRVSVPVAFRGDECFVPADASVRAAYIIETNPESGGCKETAALANA